jgi:biopolymer transport protein TolR
MAVYFSRRKLHPREHDEVGELNIVPYLDIMMNLIMFMLLTMTALITLGVLNVTAPSTSGASAGDSQKPPLTLNVSITHSGFFVAAIGGVLPGGAGASGQPTVPLKNGEFDYDALTQKMIDVKKQFPSETKIILEADSTLPYQSLIRTMDAVREYQAPDGKHPLFFDVSLSAGVM